MKAAIVLVVCALGCDSEDARISKLDACHEQAAAWCERVGYPTYGCELVYTQWCAPDGGNGTVSVHAQDLCLDAIAEMPATSDTVPASCMETWRLGCM